MNPRLLSCLLVAFLHTAPALTGRAQVIKLGTVVPEGSPWHEAILEIDAAWRRISNGSVQLRVYPGGIAGDEADMLRKMRIGQLHAAALTSGGLISVAPDIEALSFPLAIRTDAELDRVIERVGPIWEEQLEEKGFKVLTWSNAGWVRFFAKEPVASADDLRRQRLFFWGSDAQYLDLLKQLGYNPVPLAVTDLLPSLQTGLVNAFAAPPSAALAFQWFGLAQYMTDLPWAPLPSVTVISMRQWNRLPADLRPELEAAARQAGRTLRERTRRLDQEAVTAMQQYGLNVVSVSPEATEEWRGLVHEHGIPAFVGRRFSREIFDQVQSALEEFEPAPMKKAPDPAPSSGPPRNGAKVRNSHRKVGRGVPPSRSVESAPSASDPAAPSGRRRLLRHATYLPLALMLAAMPAIPALEFFGRRFFGAGLSGANDYVQHLTLWIAFLGAIFTGFAGEHLQMEVLRSVLSARMRAWTDALVGVIGALVCLALAGASLQLIVSEAPPLPEPLLRWLPGFIMDWLEPFGLTDHGNLTLVAGWMPIWMAEAIMPVGFLLLALAFLWRAGPRCAPRAIATLAAVALLAGLLLAPHWGPALRLPLLLGLLLTLPLGTPIFVLLGGTALILFWGDGVTTSAIPAETYRIVTSPVFPTIPLFTLCGFILSESHADRRLVRLFRAWFGWLPGGTAVAITLLCAFLTTFTGASGVTILALGGLLLPVLLQNGYEERFSVGLLTATGSIGLLFPPSLVVILYAVIARIPVPDMFLAGILPGTLLVGAVSLYCVGVATRTPALERPRFEAREAARALWDAKWELAIPPLILVLLFGGICTLVEAAAITVLYAFLVETAVHRDLTPARLFALLRRCGRLLGGLLIILGVAMGLTSYLVDAEVPALAAQWAEAHIHSRWMFLLFLNLALIAVGCLMDIYSALMVVVPILLPVAAVFDVDPIHLGVIFMVNLELGYLTPPVGMNLFLASFRFKRPLPRLYRDALPFLFIMLGVILLVTFLPALALAPLRLLR